MSSPPSFDLLDRPWIRVRDASGLVSEQSLRSVLARSHELRGLAGEIPTQDAAILRLLLAVLLGATRPEFERTETEAVGEWRAIWQAGVLPMAVVDAYLEPLRPRFDLLHPSTPFLQVAGLTTGSGNRSGLGKLIADLPDGAQYFTTRAGRETESMSLAEAARWLVHCQAFDPSGIKTGAVGDDRVKGGKGYPLGPPAWAGAMGLVIAVGSSLFETLLLNVPLLSSGPDDLPVWERPPLGPGVQATHATPVGPADAFTWASRRLRLFTDGDRVVDVQISNGDKPVVANGFKAEPMTAWRWSKAQSSPGSNVVMPATHDPARRIWQGLGPLLIASHTNAHDLRPVVIDWMALLRRHNALRSAHPVQLRTVGIEYGAKASTIVGAVDDQLAAPVAALTDPVLTQAAVLCANWAREGVMALVKLVADLDRAAGGEGATGRDEAFERGYGLLDGPYRAWIRALSEPDKVQSAKDTWALTASTLLRREGDALVNRAGPLAIVGRQVRRLGSDSLIALDAGLASIWFRAALKKTFPLPADKEEVVA